MPRRTLRWFVLGLGLAIAASCTLPSCASPTDVTLLITTDFDCKDLHHVTIAVGTLGAALETAPPTTVSTTCQGGYAGRLVVVPRGSADDLVAIKVVGGFGKMKQAEDCVATYDAASPSGRPGYGPGCIVARRALRYTRHATLTVPIVLRAACDGVACGETETCVSGACVSATIADSTTCRGDGCGESVLGGGGAPDGGASDGGTPEGSAPDGGDAAATTGLLGLTLSAGTLSPAFSPSTQTYVVVASVVSLGLPLTVTPMYAGGSVTINGAVVASGAPSPAIARNLLMATPIDVTFTPTVGAAATYAIVAPPVQEAYAKASNTRVSANFGYSVALSGDTLAVGSYGESSAATGINGNPLDTSAPGAGAVYVFTRSGTTWSQQAYVKASNTRPNAWFGYSVALVGDTLAVGSLQESSNAMGVDGDQANSTANQAGAVYVFTRSGAIWSQQAYVKASNTRQGAIFGSSVALSGDTLAVASREESSGANGVGGNQADTSATAAGAVYVFTRSDKTWSQQAYVKASNTRAVASFGSSVALSGDTLAVGSSNESSGATGIDGNQLDTSGPGAGAVYVFTRSVAAWSQQAYVKATNTRPSAQFGFSVALSGDTLAVGASGEASNATGVNGNPGDTSAPNAGAAYVFTRSGTTWSRQAYIKASTTRMDANFGYAMALVGDALAVGSYGEASNAIGINGSQADTSAPNAGAAYVFRRSGATWAQQAYVKASNPRGSALFGSSVALSGDTLAVGSYNESSGATGINGDPANPFTAAAGAVYVLR